MSSQGERWLYVLLFTLAVLAVDAFFIRWYLKQGTISQIWRAIQAIPDKEKEYHQLQDKLKSVKNGIRIAQNTLSQYEESNERLRKELENGQSSF